MNELIGRVFSFEKTVFPNQSAWDAGVRTVICEIRGTAGKLTGSVRGLG